MTFVDEATVRIAAGHGGSGCVAFRREKFIPRGGPSGGDGGHGGSVWVVGESRLNTLYHLRYTAGFEAVRGMGGEGSNRSGRSGSDLEIPVPLGTVVREAESHKLLAEVLDGGQRVLLAKGGRGGKGNAHFKSSTHQTPRFAQPGEEGEELVAEFELKLLADVGVVGLPNAGKSTLISVLTAARPKIADYPFTTLVPQLGVVARGTVATPFVMADLPGLIAGAAAGVGLGVRFLKHVERCRVLVHLVDLSFGEVSARADLETVEQELGEFDSLLLERPRLIVGSKLDAAEETRQGELRAAAGERGLPYFELSAATHQGLDPLVSSLSALLESTPRMVPRKEDEWQASG